MANRSRVPQKDSLFDSYIRNTTTVLTSGSPDIGSIRLGLSTAQANQWIAYRDAWVDIYPLYTNPATRTKAIKDDKNQLKKDFKTFAVNPLKRIESSENITNSDRNTFNLPIPVETAPSERGPINDIPFGSLKGAGGGMLDVRVRRENDATRSSMHPLSDVVEFKYLIFGEPNPNPPTGDNPPTPDNCPNSVMSTAALWRMNVGTGRLGKRIMGFFRWVNLTNPDNNSGWSDIVTTIIS